MTGGSEGVLSHRRTLKSHVRVHSSAQTDQSPTKKEESVEPCLAIEAISQGLSAILVHRKKV